MKWFGYVREVVAGITVAIPLITTLIHQFETPGFGEDKLNAVLAATESALVALGIRAEIVAMIKKGAAGIINAYVALKNIVGEFTHSSEEGDSE